MRPVHPLHNPFINRFNDPVNRRQDEMQSDAYMNWLRERDQAVGPTKHISNLPVVTQPKSRGRLFAGVVGLMVLIVSFALLLKVM